MAPKKVAPAILKPVDSSAFTHAGYDPAKKEFHVKFKDGSAWAYDNVDQSHEVGFEHASSKGAYFMRKIKPHHTARRL